MKITFLGHAGLFLETASASILCDPWFEPAYFASWFPFPSNEGVDTTLVRCPTYLYISHLHQDHFDANFLRNYVWKEAVVILPDYPLPLLERALRGCGFHTFLQTKNGQFVNLGGLRLMTVAMVSPIDGPLGDSGLVVDDGTACIFHQNDSRPRDMKVFSTLGHITAHFVQFSGAIWYPMVYQFPAPMKQALGRKKRANEMARALHYVQHIGASAVFPCAGPPCFLDEDLFFYNDFDDDPTNIFPDQAVFLEYLRAQGVNTGHLIIPGSTIECMNDTCLVTHPLPEEHVQAIFREKRAYLQAYQARQQPQIDAIKKTWPLGQIDLCTELQAWFEPLLEQADLTCAGVNGRLLLESDVQQVMIDFQQRRVYPSIDNGQEQWDYRFRIDHALLEYCILHHIEDWVNQLFLSYRFEATRKGPYNEYLYTFFKSLSPERLQYVESYYAHQHTVQQIIFEHQGYRLQRYCPHMKGDLQRFGIIEDGILTCTLHGWQFDLHTGRCLTSPAYRLLVQPLAPEESLQCSEPSGGVPMTRCSHCWYHTSDIAPPARDKPSNCASNPM